MGNEKNLLEKGIGVGGTSILDTAMIKLSEFAVDEVSSRMGFNGTLLSGATKVGTAVVTSMFLPKGIAQNVNSGLMADGMTDLYVSGKKMLFSGNKSGNTGAVVPLRVI